MSELKEFGTYNGLLYYRGPVKAPAIVFDVDGTLIDSRWSYNATITNTVKALFGWATGLFPSDEEILKAASKLRLTGGFNNDWDTTFSILMGLFSGLPDQALKSLTGNELVFFESRPPLRLKRDLLEDSYRALGYLITYADKRGLESVLEGLEKLYNKKEKLTYIRALASEKLGYPGLPKDSVLARTFEELYLGGDLFKDIWSTEPKFKINRGAIEDEKPVLEQDVASLVKRTFGEKVGIASGRPRATAVKSLGKLLGDLFNTEASLFIDDAVRESSEKWLGKPNEYMLVRSMEAMGVKECIYVGDSVEDMLMAKNAESKGYRIHFVGVYLYTISPRDYIRSFLDGGAEAVLPTVNELRFII